MQDDVIGANQPPAKAAHITTRRSFVALSSLSAVSLYGLWAGLGTAPLRFWETGGSSQGEMNMDSGNHDGHGSPSGPSPDEFRQRVDAFVEAHKQPDGSVLAEQDASNSTQGMDMPGMSDQQGTSDHVMNNGGSDIGPEVYILAQKWSFEPSWIKLRAGVPYKLKLMAVDAAHGASLQLGPASQIIRLPKGVLVERELNFTKAGTYLLYCTMYCGEGHQYMSGKIEVL
ncbi:MAG: hypothetical protein K8F90_17795 [Hyphomicrobiales bacterium]|nr:hypothetical protein [Hyphomicrobiales bacterium]